MVLCAFFAFLIFQSNWATAFAWAMAFIRFSKPSRFSNIWCCLERFFAQDNCNILKEWFFARFWHFFFNHVAFAWAIAFARWLLFKMFSFLEYFVFFDRFFAHNNSNVLVECFFARFLLFYFLTKTEHFSKAIAFAWAIAFSRWLIFKIVSFLEYLVLFRPIFCTEQF